MQMTFSLAWLTGHGMRRKEGTAETGECGVLMSNRRNVCYVTDCFLERLTDSFSFFFLTVRLNAPNKALGESFKLLVTVKIHSL